MDFSKKITLADIQEEIEVLKNIFSLVVLLDENSRKNDFSHIINKNMFNNEKEFNFAKYVAGIAFSEKRLTSKMKITDLHIYQVIARYIEIEGEPYVIETIGYYPKDSLLCSDKNSEISSEDIYTDTLTGVFSRCYYEECLKDNIVSAGVIMIDINDFNLYNKTAGYEAGNEILKKIVKIIKDSVRLSDIIIRYGGDEFLLIMPGIVSERFKNQVKYLKRCVKKIESSKSSDLSLSASVGGVIAENERLGNAVLQAQKNMLFTEKKDLINFVGDSSLNFFENEQINIIIADDADINREILSSILGDEFNIIEASDGKQCIELLEKYGTSISVLLLDMIMPNVNGFDVLKYMNSNRFIENIPVIIISSDNSAEAVNEAYELGITDYITRPFNAKIVYSRVINTVKLYSKQRHLTTLLAEQAYEKEKDNNIMITILSHIVEFRNGESGQHVVNIRIITKMLIDRLSQKPNNYNISDEMKKMIVTASALHDIGKIVISDEILNKPGRLTPEEFEIIKKHSIYGAEMLDSIEKYKNEDIVRISRDICRWHHERWSGKGYPDGLKGDEIPMSAQLVSVADVYDALVSERVYKKAYSHEKAMKIIQGGECGEFNPLLLECLEEIGDQLKKNYLN